MVNQLINYKECGRKAAKARKQGDEALARFESDYANRMWNVETGEDRARAKLAYQDAYRAFSQ